MRNLFILCCLILTSASVQAQIPQKMSYQLVVRNSENNIVANQQVGVRVSILQGAANGNSVFTETHTPQTNVNGLASFIIGDGTAVTGNLSTIDWSLGPYFIKTDVDPAGGTNYSISSTTQLLSVPYAMHAGSAPSQGKGYIILNGAITDEEAAAIIARDAGPQTQFVYVENTTALKNLNLGGVKNLLELRITGNADLLTVSAPSLDFVLTKLEVGGNLLLNTLSLPVLTRLGGAPYKHSINAGSVTTLSFPKLIGSSLASLNISGNQLLSVDFPVLQHFGELFVGGTTINSLTIPVLSTISSLTLNGTQLVAMSAPSLTSGNLQFSNNNSLVSVSLPTLTSGNLSFFSNHSLVSVSAPSLNSGNVRATSNHKLTTLLFPVLAKSTLNLQEDSSLINLDLPQLVSGDIILNNNKNLQSISFPQLRKVVSIDVVGNSKLVSASFPEVDSSGRITFSNTLLNTLAFPKLLTGENINLSTSPNLGVVSFPALKTINNISILMMANNDFHSLVTANNIGIASGSVDFSSLYKCNQFYFAPTVFKVAIPALTYAGTVSFAGKQVNEIALAELKVVESLSINEANNLQFLSLPKLDTVNSGITITRNLRLPSLSFPQLRSVKREIRINSNANFSDIGFPLLNELGTALEATGNPTALSLSNNRLPSSVINSVLAKLVSINPPLIRRTFELTQVPPAPPTGQGVLDKAALQGRPNIVNTN